MTTITRTSDAATVVPTLVLSNWSSDDEPQTLVHPILGREFPDVTLRPAMARTGTLRLFFWDYAAADAARKFHHAAAVFRTVTDMAWLPRAYVPNGPIRCTQQAENAARWVLEIPFQELEA